MANEKKNRRKLRNLLLDPRVQYRYGYYFLAFSVGAALLNQVFLVSSMRSMLLRALADSNVDPISLAGNVAGPIRVIAVGTTLILPVMGLLCFGFAILVTHKFVGPQVALKRHIAKLKAGNYASECRLRKDDELQELADELNELAEALEQRHGADVLVRQDAA